MITSFAINVANLTALYLTKTNLHDAVVLADSFHTDKFYSLVQVTAILFSQFQLAMLQTNQYILRTMLLSWDA